MARAFRGERRASSVARRKRLPDLRGGAERECTEGERGVGATARHAGRRAHDEKILVVVGAAPRVGDTVGGIVAHATAAGGVLLGRTAPGGKRSPPAPAGPVRHT